MTGEAVVTGEAIVKGAKVVVGAAMAPMHQQHISYSMHIGTPHGAVIRSSLGDELTKAS